PATAADGTTQPRGRLLPPLEARVTEQQSPPIARLGFSLAGPESQAQTPPSTVPETTLPAPRLVEPKTPKANPTAELPRAPHQQPATQVIPHLGEVEPLEEPRFPPGDPNKVVPVNLARVMQWAEARSLGAEGLLEASVAYV